MAFEPEESAEQWREETGVRFTVLLDPDRSVYRAYGLERSVRRTWTLRTIRHYVAAIVRGERLHRPHGDPYQLGGDFLVDASGIVRLAHRSVDPIDRPSVDRVLDVARRIPAT